MNEKFRVVVNYKDWSNRVVADSVSYNAAVTLQDAFWSIDDGEIQSISLERAEDETISFSQ